MNLQGQLSLGYELFNKHIKYWYYEVLWSFHWWFGIVCTFFSLYILYKKIDRKRFVPIFLYGFCCVEIGLTIDAIGLFFPLWVYPYPTHPLFEPLFGADLFFLTMPCILLYQKYSGWKPYFIGAILLSLFFAFVVEPFANWLNTYLLLNWEYYYSFPLYVILLLLSKGFADKIERMQLSYSEGSRSK